MPHINIGRSSSTCSECGGNASPDDTEHIRGGPKSGYVEGSDLGSNNGCRVAWSHRSFNYWYPPEVLALFNLTDMSKPFRTPLLPEPLKHGQLAYITLPGLGEPVLSIYRDYDYDAQYDFKMDPYWALFGTEHFYHPEEVTIVRLVKVVDE